MKFSKISQQLLLWSNSTFCDQFVVIHCKCTTMVLDGSCCGAGRLKYFILWWIFPWLCEQVHFCKGVNNSSMMRRYIGGSESEGHFRLVNEAYTMCVSCPSLFSSTLLHMYSLPLLLLSSIQWQSGLYQSLKIHWSIYSCTPHPHTWNDCHYHVWCLVMVPD